MDEEKVDEVDEVEIEVEEEISSGNVTAESSFSLLPPLFYE